MGLLLSTPEKLVYLRVLIPKDYMDSVMSALHEIGVMQVEPIGKIPQKDKEALMKELSLVKQLVKLVESLETFYETPKIVKLKEEIEVPHLPKLVRDLIHTLETREEELNNLLSNMEKIGEELKSKESLLKYLRALPPKFMNASLSDLMFEGENIYSLLLHGKPESVNNLIKSLPKDVIVLCEVPVDDELLVLLAGLKTSKEVVMEIASRYKVEKVAMPEKSKQMKVNDYLTQIENEVRALRENRKEVKARIDDILRRSSSDVALGKVLSDLYGDRLNAVLNALAGNYLMGIEGWVPVTDIDTLEKALSRAANTYFLSELSVDKEPPAKLRNPKPFKPFELITKLYGLPSKNEWDPTPIIVYSFMIFFGTMFADAIYGVLMFILIKYVLERTGLVDNPYSEGYLTLKRMLLTLAISSTVFGVLSNTFAGFSIMRTQNGWAFGPAGKNALIPSLLAFTNPIWFLKYALIVGFLHINLSHGISLVKGFRERDSGKVITEAGIFLGEFFGIPYIFHTTMHYDFLPLSQETYTLFLYGSLIALGIIIAGTVKSSGGQGFILWLFTVTGLLGDVLSYSRLAGIGLATYMMAESFNSLAIGMAQSLNSMIPLIGIGIGVLAAAFVMLVMNLITIIFGIIGAFVHSLRLCFVEFLPKWYEGAGKEFKPFKVEIPSHILIGKGM